MQFPIQNIYPPNYSAKQTNWPKHFGYLLYHAHSVSVVLGFLQTLIRCQVEKVDIRCLQNKSFDKRFLKMNLRIKENIGI